MGYTHNDEHANIEVCNLWSCYQADDVHTLDGGHSQHPSSIAASFTKCERVFPEVGVSKGVFNA